MPPEIAQYFSDYGCLPDGSLDGWVGAYYTPCSTIECKDDPKCKRDQYGRYLYDLDDKTMFGPYETENAIHPVIWVGAMTAVTGLIYLMYGIFKGYQSSQKGLSEKIVQKCKKPLQLRTDQSVGVQRTKGKSSSLRAVL